MAGSWSARHEVAATSGNDGKPPSLERALESGDIVRALGAYDLTQADIAQVTGVTPRAVRNWVRTSALRREHEDRLDALREVVLVLKDVVRPRAVGRWLRARSTYLGGRRPLDALAADDTKAVLDAANAFRDGDYL